MARKLPGRLVDLSHSLQPGKEEYHLDLATHFTDELYPQYIRSPDTWYILQDISMSSHCGTHIEFPYHHNRNGMDAATFPLERLIGDCVLLDFRHKQPGDMVSREDLAPHAARIHAGDMLLFNFNCARLYRTPRSHDRPQIAMDAIRWLIADRKISLIGSDASGIELKGVPDQPNHQLLMDNGIPIIEFAANLDDLRAERFTLFVLALSVQGLDSCPVRLLALEDDPGAAMDKAAALGLYRKMVEIRRFEEKLYYLFSTRDMPGSMHQYNGEEAVAVGVCAHLSPADYITSTHRGHGHCIAKGADIRAVMAEMFAKSTGCCRGMGGSMHIADFSVGMLGANGIVAAGIPIAVGAGLTCQVQAKGNVAVAFFGDGAVNEGAFHEAVNLAAVWRLPVVFVCENNVYGFSTHYRRTMLLEDIADRSAAYGIPGVVVDGMDLRLVHAAAGEAVRRAREGGGPTLLEAKTYRFMGHSRFEPSSYRSREELAEWKKRDPIALFRSVLLAEAGASEAEIARMEAAVDEVIEESVRFAEQSPDPAPGDWRRYIFAGEDG